MVGSWLTHFTEAPGELPVYNWHPTVLANANASAEHLTRLLHAHIQANAGESIDNLQEWINSELIINRLGIHDALEIELNRLASNPLAAMTTFSHMVSIRARIGWSTHGHSAVDVNVYSSGGPEAQRIRGNVENTDVGEFLKGYLGVNVEAITKELRDKMRGGQKVAAVAVEEDVKTPEPTDVSGAHPVEWLVQA